MQCHLILEKIIINTKDNLIRLLTVLVVIINSQNVKDEIKRKYDEIKLENKKYYADNDYLKCRILLNRRGKT